MKFSKLTNNPNFKDVDKEFDGLYFQIIKNLEQKLTGDEKVFVDLFKQDFMRDLIEECYNRGVIIGVNVVAKKLERQAIAAGMASKNPPKKPSN